MLLNRLNSQLSTELAVATENEMDNYSSRMPDDVSNSLAKPQRDRKEEGETDPFNQTEISSLAGEHCPQCRETRKPQKPN